MSRAHHNNGKKAIAEICSGSVTIPIYASPVTVKLGKKPPQEAEADSKSDGGGSDCETYCSFKIVYYESWLHPPPQIGPDLGNAKSAGPPLCPNFFDGGSSLPKPEAAAKTTGEL